MEGGNSLILTRLIMKITAKIGIAFIALALIIGCGEEEFVGQPGTDGSAPGAITNLSYKATPGGAVISYTPPSDVDFSHVEAIYSVSENLERKSTSTKFTQNILVDGFGNTEPQQVDLFAVDKSGNRSEKVSIDVVPDTPPYITIFESLEVENGFGGVFMDWENDDDERVDNIGLTVLKADRFGDFVPFEVIYDDNTKPETSYSVRGLDTLEVELRFFVRDEFDHVSDTLVGTYKPLFEIEIDHRNITPLELDTDALTNPGSGYDIKKIADGVLGNQRLNTVQHYHSIKDTDLSYFPLHITVDLSVETALSRFNLNSTYWDQYKNGGIKRFELYGTNDQSLIDRETNGSYVWPDNDDPNITGNWREEGMDGWELIGEYETWKPSGLPGTQVVSNADGDTDRNFARENGFEFQMPGGTSYRYIRLRATELWADGLEYISIGELRFWGGPKE